MSHMLKFTTDVHTNVEHRVSGVGQREDLPQQYSHYPADLGQRQDLPSVKREEH